MRCLRRPSLDRGVVRERPVRAALATEVEVLATGEGERARRGPAVEPGAGVRLVGGSYRLRRRADEVEPLVGAPVCLHLREPQPRSPEDRVR